ncbi:MAG TPA: VanW family protein [Feifaniaceae bacterium]|nr:VanW family protein [Feifaniaceae bacterium]
MAKRKKEKSSALRRTLRAAVILLAAACLGLGGFLVYQRVAEPAFTEPDFLEPGAQTFAEGVSVEGVSLAGMTPEQARAALHEAERQKAAEIQFVLHAPGASVTLTSADFDVTFDTETVLGEAIALGNTGTRREKDAEREALLASPREFSISYTADVSPAQPKLIELGQRVRTDPVDASAKLKEQYTVKADMVPEDFLDFTPEVNGQALDEAALLHTLQTRAEAREYGEVELPILYTEPAVTVDALKESLLSRRSVAETSFKKSPYNREDRVFNVKRAASLINGFVLKPGETFSTNDTLGPRTYELGWKAAPAYVQGATEDQAGGGVCQVSTTLYAAVVKADLEIVYRRNHSSPVGYIDRGLDATINTGTIDFQFKNNTEADIYIFAYAIDSKDGEVPKGLADKSMHVEIYGAPLGGEYDEIRLSSEKIETVSPKGEMEVVVDTTVSADYYKEEVSRQSGSVWQSYKHYYKDGQEIRKEPLAKSTYRAYAGKITVGVGYYAPQIPVIAPEA